jgi:hypothetical protein
LTIVMSSRSMNIATQVASRVHHFRAIGPPYTVRRRIISCTDDQYKG